MLSRLDLLLAVPALLPVLLAVWLVVSARAQQRMARVQLSAARQPVPVEDRSAVAEHAMVGS